MTAALQNGLNIPLIGCESDIKEGDALNSEYNFLIVVSIRNI